MDYLPVFALLALLILVIASFVFGVMYETKKIKSAETIRYRIRKNGLGEFWIEDDIWGSGEWMAWPQRYTSEEEAKQGLETMLEIRKKKSQIQTVSVIEKTR